MATTIRFNICGLDELFMEEIWSDDNTGTPTPGRQRLRKSIPTGSIIALCGGPGTGKTTLGLQILHSAEVEETSTTGLHPLNACVPAMVTLDAPKSQVDEMALAFEMGTRNITVYSLDSKLTVKNQSTTVREYLKDIVAPSPQKPPQGPQRGQVYEMFIALIDAVFQDIDANFTTTYKVNGPEELLFIDGLSSLLGYVPSEDRRMLLQFVIDKLRQRLKLAAAVLSFELSIPSFGKAERLDAIRYEPEHYMADAVFALFVKETVPGKRRRMLEVVKARNAYFPLGEHSLWLIHPERKKELVRLPLVGTKKIRPGVVVFPACRVPHVVPSIPRPEDRLPVSTGVPGLNEMFGSRFYDGAEPVHGRGGVLKGSVSAIIGPAGAGKTFLSLAFLLEGLDTKPVKPSNSNRGRESPLSQRLFCSFDTPERDLLEIYGSFHPTSRKDRDHQSLTLKEARNRKAIRLFYRSPDNFDPDFFFWLLGQEFAEPAPGLTHMVLDGISALERTWGPEPALQDFLTNLFSFLKQHRVTTFFTVECSVDLAQGISHVSPLSFIADNVIVATHVPVNDCNRKCLIVTKSRGQPSLSNPREMVIISKKESDQLDVTCDAVETFDEYSQLLQGRPAPVDIHLRLFSENPKEDTFVRQFTKEMKARYRNIRLSTFSKTDMRQILWEHRGVTRSEALRSDITVVSIDEPWFAWLSLPPPDVGASPEGVLSRLPTNFDRMDPYRKRQLMDFVPQVMLTASVKSPQGTDVGFFGMPQYFDMGLMFYRTDVLGKYMDIPPRYLQSPQAQEGPLSSIWGVVEFLSRKSSYAGFAFDTTIVENLVCPFVEMCWNFGAPPDFLSAIPGEQSAKTTRSTECIRQALEFLGRMAYRRYMPYPCDSGTAGQAVFCRHWFSTFQDMLCQPSDAAGTYALMPFPTEPLDNTSRQQLEQGIRDWATAVSVDPVEAFGQGQEAECLENDRERFNEAASTKDYISYLRTAYARELFEFSNDQWNVKDIVKKGGWSCSGAWYTGVLRSGRSVGPGWIIAGELADEARAERRAYCGAGFAASESFYVRHGHRQVPDIPTATFGKLRREYYLRARHRYDAFGYEQEIARLACQYFSEELFALLSEFLSMSVRADTEAEMSKQAQKMADTIIRKAFACLQRIRRQWQ